jgi:hypothetical protein
MSIEEPDADLLANLRLEVRAAYRPGRWMWEIIDARNGEFCERELDFQSAASARRSGLTRLVELLVPVPARAIAGMIAGSISPHHLIIVSRDQDALYQQLLELFGHGGGVNVIRDRRRRDRRRTERRIHNAVQARGWCVIARADVPPGRN